MFCLDGSRHEGLTGGIKMEIYFMQHGACLSKDIDPEQPLSPEGEKVIRNVARAIKKMGIRFDVILASPKKRSRQTAAFVATETGFSEKDIVETVLIKPMAPAEETIQFLKQYEDKKRVLIVGHLPSLSKVASFLLTEDSEISIHFEMGGLGRIDVEMLPTHKGEFRWYIIPDHLKLIAA